MLTKENGKQGTNITFKITIQFLKNVCKIMLLSILFGCQNTFIIKIVHQCIFPKMVLNTNEQKFEFVKLLLNTVCHQNT